MKPFQIHYVSTRVILKQPPMGIKDKILDLTRKISQELTKERPSYSKIEDWELNIMKLKKQHLAAITASLNQ